MRGINACDAIAAMGGREVEQVNFAVAVQSQEASRVANIPYSWFGRLGPSITRYVSRRVMVILLRLIYQCEIRVPDSMVCDDYPTQSAPLPWRGRPQMVEQWDMHLAVPLPMHEIRGYHDAR